MTVIDLNVERAERLTEAIKDAADELLVSRDQDARTQAYNTILEKTEALLETLQQVRYVKEQADGKLECN